MHVKGLLSVIVTLMFISNLHHKLFVYQLLKVHAQVDVVLVSVYNWFSGFLRLDRGSEAESTDILEKIGFWLHFSDVRELLEQLSVQMLLFYCR